MFFRQLPEGGTRSRTEASKHQLAVCNREIQRNRSISAAKQTADFHPCLLERDASKAAEEAKSKASHCVKLRQDIEQLEGKIADVKFTQASLLQRAQALEAEWQIAQKCPMGPESAAWRGRPSS